MSLGVPRLHGRTFLQKDLCYEIFHKDNYENSIFTTTYKFEGGNICGGGFFGGLLGGIGMGIGALAMRALGKFTGMPFGGGSGFGGFFPSFGGFPTFGNFGFAGGGFFPSFGNFSISPFWGGGNTGTSTLAGNSSTGSQPSSASSASSLSATQVNSTNNDANSIQDFRNRFSDLRNNDNNNLEKDANILFNDLVSYYNKNYKYLPKQDQNDLKNIIKKFKKYAKENKIDLSNYQAYAAEKKEEAADVKIKSEKSPEQKYNSIAFNRDLNTNEGDIYKLLGLIDTYSYANLSNDDKNAFKEKFAAYLKEHPDELDEIAYQANVKLNSELLQIVTIIKQNVAAEQENVDDENDDKVDDETSQESSSAVPAKSTDADAVQDNNKKSEQAAQPEQKAEPKKEKKVQTPQESAVKPADETDDNTKVETEINNALKQIKLDNKGTKLSKVEINELTSIKKIGINVIDTSNSIPDFINRVVLNVENNTLTVQVTEYSQIKYKLSNKKDEKTGALKFISNKNKQEYVLQKDNKGNYYLMQYSWMEGHDKADLT